MPTQNREMKEGHSSACHRYYDETERQTPNTVSGGGQCHRLLSRWYERVCLGHFASMPFILGEENVFCFCFIFGIFLSLLVLYCPLRRVQ